MIVSQTSADRFHERRIDAWAMRYRIAMGSGKKAVASKAWVAMGKEIARRPHAQVERMEIAKKLNPGPSRGFRA